MSIRGSCLCGSVAYQVERWSDRSEHCHCTHCRKTHGAAFGSYLGFEPEDFKWVRGAETVARYQSTTHSARYFCPRCGSQLAGEIQEKLCIVTLGTLDTDPGVTPEFHMFVRSKVAWYDIQDGLPQYEEYPPGVEPPAESD